MLLAAFWMHPHASGMGTHRQLGLSQCGSLTRTGWPCPTCGMTTSVTAMAHGQAWPAWKAQPAGVVLFLAAMTLAVVHTVAFASSVEISKLFRPRLAWLLIGLGVLLAGWTWKLVAGAAAGQLPLR